MYDGLEDDFELFGEEDDFDMEDDDFADFGDAFGEEDDFAEDDYFEEDDLESDLEYFDPMDVEAMEKLGALAAKGLESEEDEDAFIGALASLASRALPAAARAAPQLLRAGRAIVRRIGRSPAARSAMRAVPTIMRRTAASQLRRYSRGRPVTPTSALRSAAHHTANILRDRRRRQAIYRRNAAIARRRALARRYAHRPGYPRPYPVPRPRMRRVCRCHNVPYR
ncbi:hypothetical protein [Poseidonocella sp. HB161398]|uniref:hypothetical protein n=1 Tax=Poseidonocella sp. HB161398 TaxID=2320855 RepID=UPI001108D4CB|nr:hypothetical protein [Poseidonocella sp. HB161398]